ncbi:MAG: hypothetical protein QM581_10215 [Pseudomonas sp.]
MKRPSWFNSKHFAVALTTCAALAGVGAWLSGLNFWILLLIIFAAVLINGVIAIIEDRRQ